MNVKFIEILSSSCAIVVVEFQCYDNKRYYIRMKLLSVIDKINVDHTYYELVCTFIKKYIAD